MLNYHTNARNGALVRFNPAVRSNPTPRLASPRCPPARFQARTILPSPAFPSPAPSRFISHPTSQLRPAPCSVSFPVRVSALHRAWFRGPAPVSALTVFDFAATASPAFPAVLGFAARPVCGPDRVCFACRFAPRPSRSAPRRRPRLISGSARVSRLSVCARRPHLLSAEPSAGPRSPRLVPVRLPLDSVGPVSSRTSPV